MIRSKLLSLRISLISLVALVVATSMLRGQKDLGSVGVRPDLEVIPVVVRSSDQQALNVLKTAMTAHGLYRVANSMEEASFAFEVTPLPGARARLKITSGIPEQQLAEQIVAGSSVRNAVLKAIDVAIGRTSKLRGFFGGKFAYVGGQNGASEIFVRDVLFGEGLKVSNDRADAVLPRWSPDGRYVVYTTYATGLPNIRRIDLSTKSWKTLAAFEGTNVSPRYSPDGAKLAMILTGKGGQDLYVGNSEGKQLRNIVKSSALEASPCWSPDSGRIIYASDRSGAPQLYLTSAYGGTSSRLPTNISGYCSEPDWNPVDADLVAFTIAVGSPVRYQVALYSFSQRKAWQLTNESGDALEPNWLSDGRHLVYTWKKANSRRIVLFDTKSLNRFALSPSAIGDAYQADFLAP